MYLSSNSRVSIGFLVQKKVATDCRANCFISTICSLRSIVYFMICCSSRI